MEKSQQHVVPKRDGRWAVWRSGASRVSRIFPTEQDAVEYAKQMARKESGDLYVHRGDGTVRSRDSFSAAPVPSR
jgi:hypothetical protein